jgi:hypothetical protein
VHLVEVDVVGAQAPQGVLDRAHDPVAGTAAPVGVVLVHRHEELGGQEHVLAPALERLADDLLRDAGGVDVRGVDELMPASRARWTNK